MRSFPEDLDLPIYYATDLRSFRLLDVLDPLGGSTLEFWDRFGLLGHEYPRPYRLPALACDVAYGEEGVRGKVQQIPNQQHYSYRRHRSHHETPHSQPPEAR